MKIQIKSLLLGIVFCLTTFTAVAGEAVHRVAVHVDQNDPQVINMALNNVQNIYKYYESKGEKVAVELVAYGPGLNMYVEGKSPVAERISAMSLGLEDLTFSACGNTHRKMSEKKGKDVVLLSEVGMVPSGVIRLIELQEDGYSYIRP
ncbi:MAG: DsrE family protein [Granulosicoccus sp.]|nr:DsrE family protein [Granulosicoccus sp.]